MEAIVDSIAGARSGDWPRKVGRACRLLFCLIYIVICVLFVVAVYWDASPPVPA